ncbi:MAG: hypothetical protein IPH69_00340 [Bacteroidales bacterium]|nr:hypothetical protein [Bacteroidales bacterium]
MDALNYLFFFALKHRDFKIMEYTKTFIELKNVFSSDKETITIPDSGIGIRNIRFLSEIPAEGFLNVNDTLIPENRSFSYPVFTPSNKNSDKVILLLHGLNERSWVKYLVWAFWLAEKTGSYVILFPISFHINRSPESWKDPREMIPHMKERNSALGEISMSSFANIALSERLSEDPLRFFNSGHQTLDDIVVLIKSIKEGRHEVIPKSSNIDIFAYSIGAFLAEIIMMGNPENLFTDSRLFIFCGGSVFSQMKGSSKLIMDSLAFERLYSYYLNDFEKNIKERGPATDFLSKSQVGMAFRSMIDFGRFKSFRESVLKRLRNQIQSITLQKDLVIPSKAVVETLNKFKSKSIVDVWDFPYAYCHENPFPILTSPLSEKVDNCFEKVFASAKEFLR